ncbi:MAG: FHA domain-containing protein [Desulfosarcinaceae bacterium]
MADKHLCSGVLINRLVCACFLLLALCYNPGQVRASPDQSIDLFFVIDNSGSMRKNDPNGLTPKTVKAFLQRLPANARVGMVMFDQQARLLEPLGDLDDPKARQRLVQSLDAIDYRGQFTNSAAGIERALYELTRSGRLKAQRCIIFLTDGIVDIGNKQKDAELTQWLKNDLAAESSRENIRIFGIAFTEDADFLMIQALSQRTGGAYYRVYNPEDIADVLDRIQSRLVSVSAGQSAPDSDLSVKEPEARGLAGSQAQNSLEAASGEAQPPAPGSERGFLRFYLTLMAVILLLVGLSIFLFRKVFRFSDHPGVRTPGGRQAVDIAALQDQMPEWELQDLEKPDNPCFNFNKLRISVGRDEKNDLVIAQPTISNFHATIEFKDEAFFLEDQRSTNGTRLNERKVAPGQPVRLKSGDRIKFANHAFKFVRLDQLISGDTVMLSVTSLPSELPKPGAPNATLRADDENKLLGSLEHHLAQIKGLGAKYSDFVDQYFSGETARTLSIQAQENIQQTLVDSDQHCSPLVKGRAFYVICTLPVPISRTAQWFSERYGGFTQFVFKWIRSDAYDVTACDVFCIVTFGLDQGHWVSMTIVPTHEEENPVEIMSVDFLTDAEKTSLALDFDDHGRVI